MCREDLPRVSRLKTILEQTHQPALAALLAYKDTTRISDSLWGHTVSLFGLGSYATLAHIKQCRSQINNLMPAHPGSQHILLKFAFDGANIASKRKITEEVATIEILLDDCNLEDVRSASWRILSQ